MTEWVLIIATVWGGLAVIDFPTRERCEAAANEITWRSLPSSSTSGMRARVAWHACVNRTVFRERLQ